MRARTRRVGGVGYAVVLAGLGAGSFAYHGPQFSGADGLHNATIAAAGAFIAGDLVIRHRALARVARQSATWFAIVALGAASVVNLLTRTGAPGCRPDSLLQGHALWHVLTAAALAAWASARAST